MSYFHIAMKFAAAAAFAATIGVAGTPAHASLTLNSLTLNALTVNSLIFNALNSSGSALEDLNGVAVEAATAPDENGDNTRSRRQEGTVAPGALAFDPKPIPPGSEDW